MSEVVPLFKSHYSLGRSILTLDKADSILDDGPDSIIDICAKNDLKRVTLLDDNMSGFLQAYLNSKEAGLDLTFGLRLRILDDCEDKSEGSLAKTCKYVIFAKNKEGYKRLIKIYSHAAKVGFYYFPRIDFKALKQYWSNNDLKFCVPFYDSFVFRNCLEYSSCVPELDYVDPTFFLEDNDLPFDSLVTERVKKFCRDKYPTQKVKSIFYKEKKDFKSYLTFRCINNRTTLDKPNFDHMCSDKFSFESWANQSGIKMAKTKSSPLKKPLKKPRGADKSNVIVLTKEQQKYANRIGEKRQKYNDSIKKKDAYGFKGDGKEIHTQGVRAELAVSLALNQSWIDFKEDYESITADVGSNIQVRSTNHSNGNLLVHPKDKDDQIFILVKSHDYPEMEVSGWVLGRDAKKKEFWEDGSNLPSFEGRACYLFPCEKLNPIETLKLFNYGS